MSEFHRNQGRRMFPWLNIDFWMDFNWFEFVFKESRNAYVQATRRLTAAACRRNANYNW